MAKGVEQNSRADFFVHPDYHRLGGYLVTGEIEAYETTLHQRIDGSELPVLIYDPSVAGVGDFWGQFPTEQRFPSMRDRGPLDGGYETQVGFNRLMSERDVLTGVVHGSYLGECVKGFKRRLRTFGESGILYVRSPFEIGYIDDISYPEVVKYGLVLRNDNKELGDFPEFQGLSSGLPIRYYSEDARIFVAAGPK